MTTPKQLLKELSFTIIDLETTGGNQKRDKIIEIGLVRIEKLKITKEKDFLIKPNIKIPEFIQKLTTIRPEDVENQRPFEEVIDEVLAFIGDSILVAHNTAFDIPFLNSELERMQRAPLKNRSLCTNLMTKYLIPNILNSNLNYMSRIFNIEHRKAHRAIDDAKATAELLLIYLNIFIEKKINKINHLYYPKNRYELDRRTIKRGTKGYFKFIENVKTPYLLTVKGENGIILLAQPVTNQPGELQFIQRQLRKLPWQNLTIKMYGDFLEAFINYIPHFQKMEVELRKESVELLYMTYLERNYSSVAKEKDLLTINQEKEREKKSLGDFFVIPHLVPEQLVIAPLHIPQTKQLLTFRYPAHQKKLIQYINSKAARLDRLMKGRIPPMLSDFYYRYINHRIKTEGKSILLFPKNYAKQNSEGLFLELNEFLVNNIPQYRYPKDHI